MSIYYSTFEIGLEHSRRCKRTRRVRRNVYEQDDSQPCSCGSMPIRYRGCHVLPSDGDDRAGYLDLAAIPAFIRRHGRDYSRKDGWHKWLRFGLGDGKKDVTVVLTRKQVEKLRDSLTEWLGGVT